MVRPAKTRLLQMIRNTSKTDYKEVQKHMPLFAKGFSLEKVYRMASKVKNVWNANGWRTIFDAFRSYGNKGKRAAKRKAKKKPASGNNDRDDEKQGVVADPAYKKTVRRKPAKKKPAKKGTLRAKRIKLSAKKKASVKQARVAFGRIPIWKLRKVPLLKLFGTHFPNG
jgi:hypothetical protein